MNMIVKFTYESGHAEIYTAGNPNVDYRNRTKEQIKRSADKAVKDMLKMLRKQKIPFKMEVTIV